MKMIPRLSIERLPMVTQASGLSIHAPSLQISVSRCREKLPLLLKNTGTRTIKSSGRDWIYCDPSDAGSGSACLNCGNLLSCLIYSFLVMDGQRFNSQDNKILEIIKRRLKKHFVAARIEFGNGSVTR